MRRWPGVRRVARGAVGGLPLLLAGCFAGYAYPTLSSTPAVRVEAPAEEVRAFRVEQVEEETACEFPYVPGFGQLLCAPQRSHVDRFMLQGIPFGEGDRVPAQRTVALDRGWVWDRLAVKDSEHVRHALAVRLYRPGWETVEVSAGRRDGPVTWRAARGPEGRERAVDDLLLGRPADNPGRCAEAVPGVEELDWASRPQSLLDLERSVVTLAPGSTSDGHRDALLFAAGEYERVARLPDASAESRRRLTKKAATLRELAGR